MRVSAGRPLWIYGIMVTLGCSKGDQAPAVVASGEEAAATAASDVKTDNACQLLTKAEAAAVLSSSIKKVGDEGQPAPIGTMLRSSCFYRSDDGGTVQLTVNSFQTPDDAAKRFDQLKGMYSGARQVDGVGDAAFMHLETLVAKQGNRYLTVEFKPEGSRKITDYANTQQMDAILADERAVVSRALSRLPAATSTTVAAEGESGPAKGVCAMVPKEEMESILGGPLTHAVPTTSPGKSVCTYTGAGGRYAQVSVEPQGGETGMAGARMAGAMMGNAGGGKATTPVEGVGDEALMLIGGVLNVRKGPALITVDLRMQENSEEKAKAIAQKVMAKL
ncbi:MAG TPA: hypothetical protein VIF83_04195 [Gemmatimonadaceae bacterium]